MNYIKVSNKNKEAIKYVHRATEMSAPLFMGKVNVLGMRSDLFKELNIADKEQFKNSNYRLVYSYYKGVLCYGIMLDEFLYLCPTTEFVEEGKRLEVINKLKIEIKEDLIKLLDKYIDELQKYSYYMKLIGQAEKTTVVHDNGVKVSTVIDKNLVPAGVNLNPTSIFFGNIKKVIDFLKEKEAYQEMIDNKVGVFDIVEDKKYSYVSLRIDKDRLIK